MFRTKQRWCAKTSRRLVKVFWRYRQSNVVSEHPVCERLCTNLTIKLKKNYRCTRFDPAATASIFLIHSLLLIITRGTSLTPRDFQTKTCLQTACFDYRVPLNTLAHDDLFALFSRHKGLQNKSRRICWHARYCRMSIDVWYNGLSLGLYYDLWSPRDTQCPEDVVLSK